MGAYQASRFFWVQDEFLKATLNGCPIQCSLAAHEGTSIRSDVPLWPHLGAKAQPEHQN